MPRYQRHEPYYRRLLDIVPIQSALDIARYHRYKVALAMSSPTAALAAVTTVSNTDSDLAAFWAAMGTLEIPAPTIAATSTLAPAAVITTPPPHPVIIIDDDDNIAPPRNKKRKVIELSSDDDEFRPPPSKKVKKAPQPYNSDLLEVVKRLTDMAEDNGRLLQRLNEVTRRAEKAEVKVHETEEYLEQVQKRCDELASSNNKIRDKFRTKQEHIRRLREIFGENKKWPHAYLGEDEPKQTQTKEK